MWKRFYSGNPSQNRGPCRMEGRNEKTVPQRLYGMTESRPECTPARVAWRHGGRKSLRRTVCISRTSVLQQAVLCRDRHLRTFVSVCGSGGCGPDGERRAPLTGRESLVQRRGEQAWLKRSRQCHRARQGLKGGTIVPASSSTETIARMGVKLHCEESASSQRGLRTSVLRNPLTDQAGAAGAARNR